MARRTADRASSPRPRGENLKRKAPKASTKVPTRITTKPPPNSTAESTSLPAKAAVNSMRFWVAPNHHESRSWKVVRGFSLLPSTQSSPNGPVPPQLGGGGCLAALEAELPNGNQAGRAPFLAPEQIQSICSRSHFSLYSPGPNGGSAIYQLILKLLNPYTLSKSIRPPSLPPQSQSQVKNTS